MKNKESTIKVIEFKHQLCLIKGNILKEVSFSFLVNNIFNTLYESNGYSYSYISEKQIVTENFYYPQAGTNVLVGVNLKF